MISVFFLLCCPGLLTVNPKERLTMQELRKSEWINGTNLETTPLATPDVLSLTRGSINTVQNQITATLSAFHQARRAGFCLQDVSNAPLVRRRKRMREEGGSSGSTDSSRASTPVPRAGTPIPPTMNVLSPLAVSTTTSPLVGVMLPDTPGTASFQACSSVVETQPVTSDSLPLPQLAASQSVSAVLHFLERDDSAASCGFGPHNFAYSYSTGLHLPSAAASCPSHQSTPNHSPAQPTDGSSSSHGSTPRRSPVSRTASFTSLGFSPAASAASSSENSCLPSTPTAASEIPSSISHYDVSCTVGSCLDNGGGRKRKLLDDSGRQSYTTDDDDDDDDDDDCVIIGVSGEGILSSSSDSCKKMRTQL